MNGKGIGISLAGSRGHSPIITSQPQSRNGYHIPLESLPKPSFSAPVSSASSVYGQLLPESAYIDKDDEQDLHSQIQKQAEAIRHQQDAFRAEREGWEFERSRLNRRIASLEGLLKSSNTHSPAGSPPFAPYQQGFVPLPSNGRAATSLTTSRLPSIAEDTTAPKTPPASTKRRTSIRRDSAPGKIDLTDAKPSFSMDGQSETKRAKLDADHDTEMMGSHSPSHDILSPPPAAYTAHAGHTPIKILDRPMLDMSPTTSHKSTHSVDHITESNTQFNLLNSAQSGQEHADPDLQGPLKLPGLPNDAGPDDFTIEILTKRLQHICENPDENGPAALRAPGNDENGDSGAIGSAVSPSTSSSLDPSPPPPARTSPQISGEKSPVPSPTGNRDGHGRGRGRGRGRETSHGDEGDDDEGEDLQHRGIKLKKKPSCNFGAPFGQLGSMGGSRKS